MISKKFKLSLFSLSIILLISTMNVSAATQAVENRNFENVTYDGPMINGFEDWTEYNTVMVSSDSYSGNRAAHLKRSPSDGYGRIVQEFSSPIDTDEINHVKFYAKTSIGSAAPGLVVKLHLSFGGFVQQYWDSNQLTTSYQLFEFTRSSIPEDTYVEKIEFKATFDDNIWEAVNDIYVDLVSITYAALPCSWPYCVN